MCKCCQLCLEELYWTCWEEKHSYDENIANYDPSEDEYARKNGPGMMNGAALENNNQPVTSQPTRMQRNISANSTKIHEGDCRREIQIANVNLAPEILAVFSNSQIFNDHKPLKSKSSPPQQQQPATFSIGAERIDAKEVSSDKLLERLEEVNKPSTSTRTRQFTTPPTIIETPAVNDSDDGVILRPHNLQAAASTNEKFNSSVEKSVVNNFKHMHLSSTSNFILTRPASMNDITSISTPKKSVNELGNVSSTMEINRFSMTPEVPSISFAHLPKNYLDTPTVEKYRKEPPTLLEIQTAELRNSQIDFSMPRYYGKSDLFNINRSFDVSLAGSVNSVASADGGAHHSQHHRRHHHHGGIKNKRLKNLSAHLPTLTIPVHSSTKEKQK